MLDEDILLESGAQARVAAVPRPLRLLLVVDSLDGGGAERHVVDLASELKRRGHEVTVACSVPGALARELEVSEIELRPLMRTLVKRRLSLGFATKLRRLVREGGFSLVHAHIYASAAAAAAATSGSEVPLVVTDHTEGTWRSCRARSVSRWVYRRAAHVVVVSSAIKRLLISDYGVPASRLSLIPPAVTRVRHLRGHSAPPLPEGWVRGPLVGRVGRLQPEKGHDVFLRAAARVLPRFSAARFLVVGDGPLHPELERLAHDLGIGERVHFLGFRPDARRIIALLDVLAVSSLSDGTPLVVLEAMQAGIPVVGSAVGGIPDQIRHERDGLLVPPGDDRALAEALAGLLGDPAWARRLAEAGRRRAAEFSFERMVDDIEGTYRRVLTRRRAFCA